VIETNFLIHLNIRQVAVCFKRLTADFLGVKLSKQEVEQAQTVVKAQIVDPPPGRLVKPPSAHPVVSAEASARVASRAGLADKALPLVPPAYGNTSMASTICCIQ
jgi:hypothetical protein